MVDSAITTILSFKAKAYSQYGRGSWVSEHRLLDILSRQTVTDGEAQNIDYFISMRPDEMAPRMRPVPSSTSVLKP